ncbi:MAG: metallophosphoesterase family protein [Bacilli bacterium]
MKSFTFLHIADIHADATFKGLAGMPKSFVNVFKHAVRQSLTLLIDEAIRRNVDAVFIAGDLFHHTERTLQSYSMFLRAFQRLEAHNIAVFICYGNHDPLLSDVKGFHFGENVYEFTSSDPTTMTHTFKDGKTVAVHSFSYTSKHIYERKITAFPAKVDADWNIGMMHGSVASDSAHEPYAPFTIQELTAKQMDYWALGHIHKPMVVCEEPLAIYPGSIQGLHRNETGAHGGVFVTLNSQEENSYEWYNTHQVEWLNPQLQIMPTSDGEVLVAMQQLKENLRATTRNAYIHITLDTGAYEVSPYVLEEFQQLLNEEEQVPFLWYGPIQYERTMPVENSEYYLLKEMESYLEHTFQTSLQEIAQQDVLLASIIHELTEEETDTLCKSVKRRMNVT